MLDAAAYIFEIDVDAGWARGVDVYFENVGGGVQQTVWPLLNDFARIPVCGLIAQYNSTTLIPGPDMFSVLRKRLTVRGFIVSDFVLVCMDRLLTPMIQPETLIPTGRPLHLMTFG